MLTQTYDFWLWILKEKKLSKNSCNYFIDRVTALKKRTNRWRIRKGLLSCNKNWRILIYEGFSFGITPMKAERKRELFSNCSSPRKTLVKGESFSRSEEKPELLKYF